MFKAHLRPPATLIVAGLTFFALLSLVDIVEQVTADTLHFQLLFIDILLFMARRAFCLAVLAAQFELGVTVVIKFNPVPGLFSMTVLAFLSETTGVLVIVLMAGVTIRFNLDLVGILLMAGLTGYLVMASTQWKLGVLVVIEVELLPLPRSVALLAVLAIGTLVHIVQLVAGVTLCRCFRISVTGVTAGTVGFGVAPG